MRDWLMVLAPVVVVVYFVIHPGDLKERNAADELLRGEIGRKTADWGISVKSVEIRDVAIPVALQDAMSRQARAER